MYKMNAAEIMRELNSVQRVLEAQLGVRTVLFRAPFARGSNREFTLSSTLAKAIADLGYLVSGIDVDSTDYFMGQTADVIRKRVLDGIRVSDGSASVLMHDSGGNRQATVDALGGIIDDLSAAGYSFVTTHQMSGLTREAVLPPHASPGFLDAVNVQVRGQFLGWVSSIGSIAAAIALIATGLALVRLLFVIVLAHVHRRREIARAPRNWQPASVAVLVCAHRVMATTCSDP